MIPQFQAETPDGKSAEFEPLRPDDHRPRQAIGEPALRARYVASLVETIRGQGTLEPSLLQDTPLYPDPAIAGHAQYLYLVDYQWRRDRLPAELERLAHELRAALPGDWSVEPGKIIRPLVYTRASRFLLPRDSDRPSDEPYGYSIGGLGLTPALQSA